MNKFSAYVVVYDNKGNGTAIPAGEAKTRREAMELALIGLVSNPDAIEWNVEEM